ncbi:tail fiber domain-containing protein [bacterium]|nr:tail fiber domain-containing protein [bacterium]
MKKIFTILALTIVFSVNAQDFWFQGTLSTAIQTGNATASGDYSTAMGAYTTASGDYSTAMGYNTTASGDFGSTAMGRSTTASGSRSTAMGESTTASGYSSTAMGYETTAIGNYSTAMGYDTEASGYASTTMGRLTKAGGNYSTAMGFKTTASDYASLVIGQYNSSGSTVTNSATVFNSANTAFVIGNGVDGSNTSDAFKVLFNGDATVGNDLTVEGDVVINSDMRLKANILSLGSTLYKLLQIDGKTYTMKRDATKKQKIGLLAQDIEKVFPELVVENKGVKSVNYQGLVPVLINALKEQQAEIDELKKQEKRLERLEAIISNMDK